MESGTSWEAGGATSPPAECFGIKYSFNYLRERFIALRKVRREKTGSDRRVHEKCFSLKTYNGYECRESFLNLFPMVICFGCAYKDISVCCTFFDIIRHVLQYISIIDCGVPWWTLLLISTLEIRFLIRINNFVKQHLDPCCFSKLRNINLIYSFHEII